MNEKVSDDLACKIDVLSDDKKDFVTECFIFLARQDFKKDFVTWYIRFLKDELSEKQLENYGNAVESAGHMIENLINYFSKGNEVINRKLLKASVLSKIETNAEFFNLERDKDQIR